MKRLNKAQFKELMKQYPNGGIVFVEGVYDGGNYDLHVTDGDFGARLVLPLNGEVFDYDWNIEEYNNSDMFTVFDNNDVLQIIQTLVSGLKIDLKAWFEE